MTDLLNNALSPMTQVKKPQKIFIILLLTTLKLFQGKATFKNLSRYCPSSEKRFSRWYRRAFDFTTLNINLLFQSLPTVHQYIAAIDASFMKKSGNIRVENGRLGRSLLFSTDINLDTESIIRFYRARFQIEFLFRDAKQFGCRSSVTTIDLFRSFPLDGELNLAKDQFSDGVRLRLAEQRQCL